MGYTLRDDQYWPTGDVVPGHSSWRSQRAHAGGGALLEHSIHSADILTWLFGPATNVYARTRNVFGYDVEDTAVCTIEHDVGRRRHADLDLQRRARPRGTPARGVLRARRGRGHHRLPRRRARRQLPVQRPDQEPERLDVEALRDRHFAAEGIDRRDFFVYLYPAARAFVPFRPRQAARGADVRRRARRARSSTPRTDRSTRAPRPRSSSSQGRQREEGTTGRPRSTSSPRRRALYDTVSDVRTDGRMDVRTVVVRLDRRRHSACGRRTIQGQSTSGDGRVLSTKPHVSSSPTPALEFAFDHDASRKRPTTQWSYRCRTGRFQDPCDRIVRDARRHGVVHSSSTVAFMGIEGSEDRPRSEHGRDPRTPEVRRRSPTRRGALTAHSRDQSAQRVRQDAALEEHLELERRVDAGAHRELLVVGGAP